MVNELTIVSSTVLIVAWSISRDKSSRTDIIFVAWYGNRGERVFRRRLAPENFTSTSAMDDFEFATSSLLVSEFDEELRGETGLVLAMDVGDSKYDGSLCLYGLADCGVLGLIGRLGLGLKGGFWGLRGRVLGLTRSLGLKTISL